MKNTVLSFFILVMMSCSTTPKSPADLLSSENTGLSIEDMENRYPYLNVRVDFLVSDQDPGQWGSDGPPIITPEMKIRSRILSIADKELMLKKLNMVRFIVNTPEFADNVRKKQFYSSRDGKTIKTGDPFDSERLITVVQKASFHTLIIKEQLAFSAAATASAGPFLYEASDDYISNLPDIRLGIYYPNRHNWSTDYSTSSYYLGLLFHEILHNLGFTHTVPNDATHGMQRVLVETYDDPKWQQKYKKKIEAFQYYQKKYADLLQKDTVPLKKRQIGSLKNSVIHYPISDMNSFNEIIEVCILKEDGSFEIVKMKNGKIVSTIS